MTRPPYHTNRAGRRGACRLVLVAMVALGCQQRAPRPMLLPAEVRGKVTFDGRPLAFGTVTFIPELAESQGGRPGLARIEPDGTFTVGTANPTKPAGMLPGRYKVTVLAMKANPSGGSLAELTIPARYTELTTTPFSVDVAAGQNHFEFALESEK